MKFVFEGTIENYHLLIDEKIKFEYDVQSLDDAFGILVCDIVEWVCVTEQAEDYGMKYNEYDEHVLFELDEVVANATFFFFEYESVQYVAAFGTVRRMAYDR